MIDREILHQVAALGFVGLFGLTGCGVTFPDGKYQCGQDGSCPPGLSCDLNKNRCFRALDTGKSTGNDNAVSGTAGAVTGQGGSTPAPETGGTTVTARGGAGGQGASGREGSTKSGLDNTPSSAGGAGGKRAPVAGSGGATGGTGGAEITCKDQVCTDPATKLDWQQCPVGQSGSDCALGSATEFTWQEAMDSCTGDWRLPSIYELVTIVDFSKSNPPIDTNKFPNAPQYAMWSSTSVTSPPRLEESAWGLRFVDGNLSFDSKIPLPDSTGNPGKYHARCVRGNPLPVGYFTRDTKGEDLIVRDAATSLMWQGCSAGQSGGDCTGFAKTLAWQDAVNYCEGLTYAGYDDWRLPKINELISIVNYSAYNPAIDSNNFPATPVLLTNFWTSSPIVGFEDHAWFVNFTRGETTFETAVANGRGTTTSAALANLYFVRCVRNDR
jgi:hypothetical protein